MKLNWSDRKKITQLRTEWVCENRLHDAFRRTHSVRNWVTLFSIGYLLLTTACSSRTAWEYMPDMADSPALKSQEGGMRMPPVGTVPRNFQPYHYKNDPEEAAKNLMNSLPRTEAVLLSGQKLFNIYCAVCHGTGGLGDGSVVPPFPRPPSLHSDKVRGWSDGRIFHVVTEGQNMMPSYASQVDTDGRWAIIHYLRALQRSENPEAGDVEAYQQYRREKKEKGEMK